MKKALKIIGIIIGAIVLIAAVFGYYGWKKMHNFNLAHKKADYIMANLDNPAVTDKFPVKYFPKAQLEPMLTGIRQHCDWKNKDGKYVDFFTEKNIGGRDQNSFIYEYYLT